MKKIILIISLILVCSASYAQIDSTYTTKELYDMYSDDMTTLSFKKWMVKNNYAEKMSDITLYSSSPGDYLIQAHNHMLAGWGCEIIAAGLYIMSTDENYNEKDKKAFYIGAGIISLTGVVFNISGIMNIGKAGISLNGNGIGVKINF